MPLRRRLRSLRRFAGWPFADQALVAEAALALLMSHWLSRLVPGRFWLRLLQTGTKPANRGRSDPRCSRKVGLILSKLVRHLPLRVRCLPQAMAAQWMLRRRGVSSTLVFGVRRGNPQNRELEFHAWLDAEGECVVGGEEIATYLAFTPTRSAER